MAAPEIMSPEHLADLKGRCERRFAVIDNLPKEVREVVHEYGWDAVKLLRDLGVTKAAQLRHIIKAIRGEKK